MADLALCTTCGHTIDDHDAGECWAQVGGRQCACPWYRPGKEPGELLWISPGGTLGIRRRPGATLVGLLVLGLYLGLSIGRPTWWLPRVQRGHRMVTIGWLWASVAVQLPSWEPVEPEAEVEQP